MKMTSLYSVVSVILFGALVSVHGLKCNEGFNMNISGVPLYHWKQRTCAKNSKCIGQQIGVDMNLNGVVMKASMRYGACVTSVYADYLDCDTLFGKDSTFDPANLLSLIPEIEKSMNFMSDSFAQNITAELHTLLSDGTKMKTFVTGAFKFFEILGFNFEKVRPLEPSLVKMLSAVTTIHTPSPYMYNSHYANDNFYRALIEFFNVLVNLDTDNAKFRASIRKLLGNTGVNLTLTDTDPATTTLINKLPGLVRSIFPQSWQPELWYDVAFKLVGNVDPTNWTKTTEDMVATIKTSYQISEDVKAYLIPILDRIPDLVRGLQVNPNYSTTWSLELLKYFSSTDEATIAFSTAVLNFIKKLVYAPALTEIKTAIEWLPGLYYRFFPGDKLVIQEVYHKMAEGLNSFNFTNLNNTAPETKLSVMIKNLVTRLGGQVQSNSYPFYNAIVVNFSKMFYNLMNVKIDYTTYVDTFATIIDDEFQKWPAINAGKTITRLITQMGGTVPPEVKPLLDNLQPAISSLTNSPFNGKKLIVAMYQITSAYQTTFPESPFPDLVRRYIDITYRGFTNVDPSRALALSLEMQYWNIDLHFAIVRSLNYTKDELHRMLIKAWPEYGLYIRAMQTMNPEDLKELMRDLVTWSLSPPPHTTDGFVKAVQPTVKKMTKSIKGVLGEIRQIYAPDSCRFGSCDSDLCNSDGFIADKPDFREDLSQVAVRTSTTAADKTKDSQTTIATNAIESTAIQTTAARITDKSQAIQTTMEESTVEFTTEIQTTGVISTDITEADETTAEAGTTHSTTHRTTSTCSGERSSLSILIHITTLWIAYIIFLA